MSLTHETGAGLANAESFCSVAYADAYHANLLNTAWASATTPEKEAALRKATNYLEGLYRQRWSGQKQTQAQRLSWPRSWAEDVDGYPVDPSTVPLDVQDACAQLALPALSEDLLEDLDRGGQITSETIGPISTDYAPGAPAGKPRTSVAATLSRLLVSSNRLVRA